MSEQEAFEVLRTGVAALDVSYEGLLRCYIAKGKTPLEALEIILTEKLLRFEAQLIK